MKQVVCQFLLAVQKNRCLRSGFLQVVVIYCFYVMACGIGCVPWIAHRRLAAYFGRYTTACSRHFVTIFVRLAGRNQLSIAGQVDVSSIKRNNANLGIGLQRYLS